MKNYGTEFCAICKDDASVSKILRKLSVVPASITAVKMAPIYHTWLEDQVNSLVRHTRKPIAPLSSAEAGEDSANERSVNLPGNDAHTVQALPVTLKVDNDDQLGELKDITIGGVKISVKQKQQKQQKKRMKPSLMAETPNIDGVKGNINTLEGSKDHVDIRAELKQVAVAPIVYKMPGIVAPKLAALVTQTSTTVPPQQPAKCSTCVGSDDIAAIQRMVTIYVSLVVHQHVSVLQAMRLVQLAVSLDPYLAADAVLCLCGSEGTPSTRDSVLLSTGTGAKAFIKSLIESLLPVILACGALIAQEVADSPIVRAWCPELSVKIRESISLQSSENSAAAVGISTNAHTNSVHFKMPETFLKPFREEYDSKNEFRTQMELSVYYERERLYDDFSNLFSRFQSIYRSDLDGTSTAQFYRGDLLTTGAAVLGMREANYAWFADVFLRQLLFYGTSSTAAAPVLSARPKSNPQSANTPPTADSAVEKKASSASPARTKPIRVAATNLNTSAVEYAANFPSLGATQSAVTLDASKHSMLEARLGAGGEVKPPTLASSSGSTVKFATPVGAGERPTTNSTGPPGGQRKGNFSGKKGAVYPSPSAPSNSSAAAVDYFATPAGHFPGAQQFFFRFILVLNNHRFNQQLLSCMLAEVSTLLGASETAFSMSINMDSEGTRTAGITAPFVPGTGSATRRADRELVLSPEAFALRVAKLKILGRFIGILHFANEWVACDADGEPSSQRKLSTDLVERQGQLVLSLPLRAVLEESLAKRRLSLSVAWVCSYLKVSPWPCMSLLSGATDDVDCSIHIPYIDALRFLRGVLQSPDYFPIKRGLSGNRGYIMLEVQELWLALPNRLVAHVFRAPVEAIVAFTRKGSRDATPSLDQMMDITEFDAAAGIVDDGLDDQNLAFTAVFLHHITPTLESVYSALRTTRTSSATAMPGRSRAVSLGGTKKPIKRQTPSVMTAESLALREALSKPATVSLAAAPVSATHAQSPDAGAGVEQTAATTPSKAIRSTSASSTATADAAPVLPAKSPRKKASSASATTGVDRSLADIPESSFSSPSKPRTTRTPSFEAISPNYRGVSASPRTTGELKYQVPSSLGNSVPTSGRSSPAVTLFGNRSHRSYSDLNGSFARESGAGASPFRTGGGAFMLSPLKIGDAGQDNYDHRDVLERLEISFWSQHPSLQEMSNNLLGHVHAACVAHNKERVGTAVRELVALVAGLRSERDGGRFKGQVETHMKRTLHSAVAEGEQFVEDFVSKFASTTLIEMLQLYPVNPRVLKMAVYFMNQHLQAQKASLCGMFKEYCARKLNEVCVLSAKQHDKQLATASSKPSSGETSTRPGNGEQSSQQLTNLVSSGEEATPVPVSLPVEGLHALEEMCNCVVWSGVEVTISTLLCDDLHGGLELKLNVMCAESAQALRNSTAHVFAVAVECMTVVAQALGSLRANGSTFTSVIMVQFGSKSVPFLPFAAVNTLCKFCSCTLRSLAVSLSTIASTLSLTRAAELRGKMYAEVAKFITAIGPYLFYLDEFMADTSPTRSNGSEESFLSASSVILVALEVQLISLDGLCRVLTVVARCKAAAYFEACRGLVGYKASMSKLVLVFVGRLIQTEYADAGVDLSDGEDGPWYSDSSVRLQLKSVVTESLTALISALLVG